MAAVKIVGSKGRVWSFEPGSGAASHLSESIARNGFRHVTLEQVALSDHEGETQFELSDVHAELNAIHTGAGTGAGEKVRLRTLDAWAEQNGWPEAAFIKLDVEGAESDVMRGGDKYLKRTSPLVMFEIRAGSEFNFDLRDQFAALGYDSYQVIPGLNALAPLIPDEAIDGFHLNLLACKPDRAAVLATRGMLVLKGGLTVPEAPTGLWRTAMAKCRFAAGFMDKWAAALPDGDAYARALDFFFLAQDSSLPIDRRYAALRHSHALLTRNLVGQTRFAQISTYARICFDLGRRLAAGNILAKVLPAVRKRFADDSLPFMPPLSRFDAIAPGSALADWTTAAVLEGFDRCSVYSSFYGKTSAGLMADVCKTGFQSLESERRRQLMRLRRGEAAMPEALARLAQPGPDNLNADFWAARQTVTKTAS
jgi:FkbM family methyltransferase